jgi:hypothetical protein
MSGNKQMHCGITCGECPYSFLVECFENVFEGENAIAEVGFNVDVVCVEEIDEARGRYGELVRGLGLGFDSV